jgi:hypothetical protein
MSLSDDAPSKSLTTDQAFDLLGNDQRRRAIAALREFDGVVGLDQLAEATVARGEDIDPKNVTEDRRERTAAMLHHAHLPRLEDAEVVVYDAGEGQVESTEVAEELNPYFEVIDGHDSE